MKFFFFYWLWTKRAFGYFDPNIPVRALFMIPLMFSFLWPIFDSGDVVMKDIDYFVEYPRQEDLQVKNGFLSRQNVRKNEKLIYKEADGTWRYIYNYRLRSHVSYAPFRDEQTKRRIWKPVKVALHPMPSGRFWVAYLEMDGVVLANYVDRRREYFAARRSHENAYIHRFFALYGWYVSFAMIVIAYMMALIKMRKEPVGRIN